MVEAEATHFSSCRDKNPKLASMPYYGVIEDIWEIIYTPQFKVPIFKCNWVTSTAVIIERHTGMISVDLNKVGYKDEPFILASHAKQVFYVTDPTNVKLSIVLQNRKQLDLLRSVKWLLANVTLDYYSFENAELCGITNVNKPWHSVSRACPQWVIRI